MQIKISTPEVLEDITEVVGFDVETTGLTADKELTTVSVYIPSQDTTHIIPMRCKGITMDKSVKEILGDYVRQLKVVSHGFQFDGMFIYRDMGDVLPICVFDTLLYTHMAQYQKYALKEVCVDIWSQLAGTIRSFEEVFADAKVLVKQAENARQKDIYEYRLTPEHYDLTNPAKLQYIGLDPFLTYKLYQYIISGKDTSIPAEVLQGILQTMQNVEAPYCNLVAESRARGIAFDGTVFDEMSGRLMASSNREYEKLKTLVGREVNTSSTKDLAKMLFEEQGLTPVAYTATGNPSTSLEALESLAHIPVVEQVLACKESESVLRYFGTVNQFAVAGRFHPQFEQVGVDATSRIYTTKPSITQIPKSTRDIIIADPGYKLVYFDWSGAELYLCAKLAGCDELVDVYDSGQDIHAHIAKRVLGKPSVTEEEREVSKVLTFAVIYGSEGQAVSRALKVSPRKAEELVQLFFQHFPQILEYRNKVIMEAAKSGYVYTWTGRPRFILTDGVWDDKAERKAFNTVIQGGVADCLKAGQVQLKRDFPKIQFEVMVSVFDSVLAQVPEITTREIYLKYVKHISKVGGFTFRAKVGEGRTWREAQESMT